MKELKTELEETNDDIKGHLKVGLPQIIGAFSFPQVAKTFKEKYPGVLIEIVEEAGLHVEKLVEKGQIDVGFFVIPEQSKQLEKLIFKAPFVACLPVDDHLKAGATIALKQLEKDDWVLFDTSFALNHVVLESCRNENFKPNIAYKTTQ
ncbi:hypothetical protein CEQ21_02175 [Niallia circulans]|uniref:LysR substrate-binding domain-containing protein n=1 Tax=Niallia circulans TaxID=1397 RepID=A0A553SRZ6_NIACI|nr:LysR substrate-binding domain-containing protein [Niallia circulans]TRZ39775.1 hypothetical protein CEQ21_02175 [Niallia circulans]